MAITYNTQEAKAEKKATIYENFTYDTESSGGCLAKFIDLSKIIETVAQDVSEIGGKYNVLQSKYGKFTDFNEKMNANKTSLLSSIDSIRKAYDQIIKNLDDQVAYFCKNDTSFISDLESVNKMISNNDGSLTGGSASGGSSSGGGYSGGGGTSSGGGSSYGGAASSSGGGTSAGDNGNTYGDGFASGGYGANPQNYDSTMPAGTSSGYMYEDNSSNYSSQNSNNYKDVQEDVSASFTDIVGGSSAYGLRGETSNRMQGEAIPIDMPTGTNFPRPENDYFDKYRKDDTGFNGFAGVSPQEAFRNNVEVNDLPVGGMKIPEITTINPDSLNGTIVSKIVGGVDDGPKFKGDSLNDIIESSSIVGGGDLTGNTVKSYATLEGVSLGDIIGDSKHNSAVRLDNGNRISADAYVDYK